MIDPYELWDKLVGAVNTQQTGGLKPHRNFINWVDTISKSLYEEKFSVWENSQKIKDDMSRPFLKSVSIQVKDVAGANEGMASYPDDYGHFSSARYFATPEGRGYPAAGIPIYNCNGKEVKKGEKPDFLSEEFWEIWESQEDAKLKEKGLENMKKLHQYEIEEVSNSRWGSMQKHLFNSGTKYHPKITQVNGGFKVMPAGMGVIVFDYLKKPARPKFAYTVVPGNEETGEGDVIVYDKANSVMLEWSDLVEGEILNRLKKQYGEFVRNEFIYQTAEANTKTEL